MIISLDFPPCLYARSDERNGSQKHTDHSSERDHSHAAGIASDHDARSGACE